MASDRARIGYDPSRAYRGVIAQQGRVTLEADVNEEATIAGEALRLETIDIVGPAGTPDDGYKVTASASPASTTVGKGTYYLGGWRLTLDEDVALGAQPEWLDAPPLDQTGQALVALLVTEQSVCAIEDQALREVALGGPDTAARSRLIQQFPLIPVDADTCATAADAVAAILADEGVTIDPKSGQLLSQARLQVGFVPDPAPSDPCTPAAAGGYLGADNQLIRVAVIAYDAAKNAGTLLWGRNNAAFVYRATTAATTPTVLTLQSVPIDQEHAPQLGQAVEVLRSRVELKDGTFVPATMAERNFVAADAGFVTTVAAAYEFDSGQLTLADALPPEYAGDPNPLFLRLWDRIVPFGGGAATPLDAETGVTVTITLPALPAKIAARPFWRFAVRPDTPVRVYPVRYGEAPQPPDGPRQWLGDLAVIGLAGRVTEVLGDCRPTFDPLTEDKCGCCALTLDPQGVSARGGLQAVVDSLAGAPAVLTLKPGRYELIRPLLLTGDHARLVIEGCGYGATISADPEHLKDFVFGLVIIAKTDAATLRNLSFDVAMVPVGDNGGTIAGVTVAEAGYVVIEDCEFTLHFPRSGKVGGPVFGGAITVMGLAAEFSVRRNRFVGKAIVADGVVCGILAAVNNQVLTTALIGVEIEGNYFERLNAGITAFARLGEVRCADNRMREVNTGIFLADPVAGAANAFARHAVDTAEAQPEVATVVTQAYPAHFMAAVTAEPRGEPPVALEKGAPPSRSASSALLKQMRTAGVAAYDSVISARESAAKMAGAQDAAAPKPAAPKSSAQAKPTDHAEFVGNLSDVDKVAVAVQVRSPRVTAVLHLEHNDIDLVATPPNSRQGIGIAIVRSPEDDTSMLLMTANRVVAPDLRTLGGALFFVTMATVTGNLMTKPAPPDGPGGIVFGAVGVDGGHYAFNGNVFNRSAMLLPPRTFPAPDPADYWPFLNTES